MSLKRGNVDTPENFVFNEGKEVLQGKVSFRNFADSVGCAGSEVVGRLV